VSTERASPLLHCRGVTRRGIAVLLALTPFAFACNQRSVAEADRRGIEATLRSYAEAMAEAYRQGDPQPLAPLATERELQRVRISIEELEVEGRALRPTLRSLSIESIDRAGRTSYAVQTLEVWDLRVVALGTEQTVSDSPAQENRLWYTLLRENGDWRVLSRLLRSSTEPS
jgi:hypothetical protein